MSALPIPAEPERNAHVAKALRDVLNAFADTTLDRSQELQAERIQEWRADDAEALREERAERDRG